MMFASVASALGLAASLGVQSSQASPVPLNKYSDLERRFPHFNYTVNECVDFLIQAQAGWAEPAECV